MFSLSLLYKTKPSSPSRSSQGILFDLLRAFEGPRTVLE